MAITPEQYETLLDHVEAGDTLKVALKAADLQWRALARYIESDPNAAVRYATARRTAAHFYADKAQAVIEEVDKRDTEAAQVARIKAEVYRWRAAKADPSQYDDKVEHGVTLNIGTLHLDALRAPRVTARLASPEPENVP